MRVITGSARGCRLKELEGMETRPTTDRVKEGLFNIIQFDIEGRKVLDLFAGTGQLGIECLSRGAVSAVFVDERRDACRLVEENIKRARVQDRSRVVQSDYLSFLSRKGSDYDLIFLDPPYAEKLIPKALELLLSGRLIKRTSLIVCESGSDADVFGGKGELEARFEILRSVKHGIAHINLITPKRGDENDIKA